MPLINFSDALSLCQVVENYPCLYDIKSPYYSKKDAIDKAWKEISMKMKEDINECKTRWHNIRGSFSKRINSRGTRAGAKKKYYLDDALHFLRPYMKKRRHSEDNNSSNVPQSSQDNSEDSDFLNHHPHSIPEELSTEHQEPSQLQIIKVETEPETLDDTSSRDQKCSCLDFDAEMHFLRSILPDLKKMTPEQKHRFRVSTLQTIGDILYEPQQSRQLRQSWTQDTSNICQQSNANHFSVCNPINSEVFLPDCEIKIEPTTGEGSQHLHIRSDNCIIKEV